MAAAALVPQGARPSPQAPPATQASPVRTVAPERLHQYEGTRMSMASLYAIDAWGPDAAALPAAVEAAFDEVDRIDRLMSHYRADSPVSLINREAARRAVAVDRELLAFLEGAVRYSRESGGAFDITVGPLMRAWGFFGGGGRLPSPSDLAQARRHVGSSHLVFDRASGTVAFDAAGVEVDLGGIAKGYAVDRAVAVLRSHGILAALVSAGGSTVFGMGAPPGRDAWAVDVQDPLDARKVATTVRLKDRALSVSGSSEKFFERDGVRYSHIMDPRTGWPVRGVLTVAVLARTGTAGDAFDNALFVLGPDGSRRYLRTLDGVEAFFLLPAGETGWTLRRLRGGR